MAQVHIWEEDKCFPANFMGLLFRVWELYCCLPRLEEYQTLFWISSFHEGKYSGWKGQVSSCYYLPQFHAFKGRGFSNWNIIDFFDDKTSIEFDLIFCEDTKQSYTTLNSGWKATERKIMTSLRWWIFTGIIKSSQIMLKSFKIF